MSSRAIQGQSFLVTGGAGFLGSHVVEALVREGASRVVVVDSLEWGREENLARVRNYVDLVRHTIGSSPPAKLAPWLAGVDSVLHLAAVKHNQARDEAAKMLRANVEGTYDLFDRAAAAGCKRILFASSLYAYGRVRGEPLVETEAPSPATVYGGSKLTGEVQLRQIGEVRGVGWDALRFFFLYGPRQWGSAGYQSVVPKTIERLLRGEPAIVRGDGKQELDYLFVGDAVEATLAVLRRDPTNEPLNVGSGKGIAVGALIDEVIAATGVSGTKVSEPADETDGTRRVANIERIFRVVGWRPRTGLREGLEQTIESLRPGGS